LELNLSVLFQNIMKYAFLVFLETLLSFYLAESFYMTSMTFSHVVYKEISLF